MTDFRAILAELRRPRLLIRAARHGIADYRRDRDLRRLVDRATPEAALPELIREEARFEAWRRTGDAGYSLTRHVELLIAMMAETRLLPRGA